MRKKPIPTREEFHRRYAPLIRTSDFDTYNPPPVGGRYRDYYTESELEARVRYQYKYYIQKGGDCDYGN